MTLKEHPDTPLSMIVVRHGKQQPLVLVSTWRVGGSYLPALRPYFITGGENPRSVL